MRHSPIDTIISALAIIIHATPSFLLAIALAFARAFSLRLFPLGSLNSAMPPPGTLGALFDRLRHLALPVLTLSLASMPEKYFLLRNSDRRRSG